MLLAICMGMSSSVWADDVEISNAQGLMEFASRVNAGETALNATLINDIDLTGVGWTPIGNADISYSGVFDGQGHRIYGFNATSKGNGGLFGQTSAATIKNFSIDGSFTIEDGKYSGVIGQAKKSTITNIHSSLTITVSGGSHMGGVVGSTEGDTGTTISNCSFSGSITFTKDFNGSIAGIVGYMSADKVINCANHGNITFIAANCNAGGIVAYINSKDACVEHCLNTGILTCSSGTPTYGAAIVGRIKKNFTAAQLSDNYWLEGSALAAAKKDNTEGDVLPNTKKVTAEQLKSGEICYALNGNVSGGTEWFQTIPGDTYPWPFNGEIHAPIYINGRNHCDGTAYEGTTYSNEDLGIVVDQHDYVDGFCSRCNALDKNYMTANADGYFEIGTANQLKWFAAYVNQVKMDANAMLVNDIKLTEAWEVPIGNWVNSAAFKGHFDGKGHSIEGLNGKSSQNYFGLFGVISTGCVIENFTIRGEITTSYQYAGGVAAYARDTTPVIRNVHSYVNINNTFSGARLGGILGGSMNGVVIVDRCVYSGTLDGNDAGGSGNYAGMVGYINNNAGATLTISNSLFDGKLINTAETPGGSTFGGIIGYIGANPYPTIKNCLSIGTLQSAITGQICGAVKGENTVIENTYYLGELDNGSASTVGKPAIKVTAEKLASGEVTAKLGIVFRQNLDADEESEKDPYPVIPMNDVDLLEHDVVVEITETSYATLYLPDVDVIANKVTAFTGELNGERLELKPISDKTSGVCIIPAQTAVILKGAPGIYSFIPGFGATELEGNVLKGSAEDIEATGKYVLAQPENEKVGFYLADKGTIAAGKAYIELPSTEVKAFYFDGEEETAIESLTPALSKGEGAIYNIAGQRINKLQKGINIVNGKKVLK